MTKIAVYAGHGGSDFGAISNGIYEKDINLEVALELTSVLRKRGYEVINNRTTDVNRNLGVDIRLANSENVDAVIELHANSNMGIPGAGTETFYSITGKGKELAEAINTNLVALGFKDRGVKVYTNFLGGDYLGIIRETKAPAVLVEMFFLNNSQDLMLYSPQKIAVAIADAVQKLYPVVDLKDDQIASIQTTLNNLYDANLAVDGIYGSRTKRGLIRGLQRELNSQFNAGLLVDGIFGPKTKKALVNVKKGARGNITYLIQSALYVLGYDVIPDKIYGLKTEKAVLKFQRKNGILENGIDTKATQEKLFSSI